MNTGRLTHREFFEKRKQALIIHNWLVANESDFKDTAEHFQTTLQNVSAQSRFYLRHKDKPFLEWCATQKQQYVDLILRYFPHKTQIELRKPLIERYSASIGISAPYPREIPIRVAACLMKASGLEWFYKNGKPVIHWKHDKELHEQTKTETV